MIGTRAMSGSAAIRFRKRTIAACESSMPSSMLMSITWAPLVDLLARDVERRVDSHRPRSAWRNVAEPVTLVRSPTFTNRLSAVDVERLKPGRGGTLGIVVRSCVARMPAEPCADEADVLGRRAAAATDDVDAGPTRRIR